MQEINRKYPKTKTKLSGEYLRIFASTANEREETISFLKERDDQIRPNVTTVTYLTTPQRIVISKPDVLNAASRIERATAQDLIENPVCINCNETGHLANSHRCAKFPKIQPKKGAPSLNRNKSSNSFNSDQSKVKNNISFANALKGNHQMAPQNEKSVSAVDEITPAPPPKKRSQNVIENDDSGTFGFMDAIIELKKFFAEHPSLIELGKQLRNAQPHEKVDVFYRHIANQR
ncbi:hypothetical protein TNCV_4550341 [Trichonephila clavipes]|nr:hypothetical protein TNCV_4550341 [Trichonephila clavipes]